jgi:hypothetical protein
MKRTLLICLSLVLALVGWSAVCAADQANNKVVVIPLFSNDAAPVPKTGQIETYATGDDGALQKGVAWPTPRFTDNGNGTVTDNLTKLIWMKYATQGYKTWAQAMSDAATMADGNWFLTDGSQAGDWRLPNVRELQSLVDYGEFHPALPKGHPFQNVSIAYSYWSSSTHAGNANYAWEVEFEGGSTGIPQKDQNYHLAWYVRGGP